MSKVKVQNRATSGHTVSSKTKYTASQTQLGGVSQTTRVGTSYSKQTVRETNDAFSQAKKKQGVK